MSDRLGPRTFGDREELVFLGREISEQRNYSEVVAQQIDDEVKRIITSAYDTARQILTTHRERLDAVADRLVHEETIEGAEFEAMFAQMPKLASVPVPA